MTKRPKSTKYFIITEPYGFAEFEVTPDDVRGSVVADPENCAAARACKRLPGVKQAWVFRTRTVLLRDDGTAVRFKNPAALQKTVEGYDATAGLFPPGVYKLRPINPGSRKEKRDALNAANPKRENKGIRPHRQPDSRPASAVIR
jgi:hypothetical protein